MLCRREFRPFKCEGVLLTSKLAVHHGSHVCRGLICSGRVGVLLGVAVAPPEGGAPCQDLEWELGGGIGEFLELRPSIFRKDPPQKGGGKSRVVVEGV